MSTKVEQSPKQKLIIKFGGEGVNITPQHYKESFRTKDLQSAITVLSRRNSNSILNATFYNGVGLGIVLIGSPK